jgi:hypothetical protein
MPSRSHSRRQTLALGSALTLVFAGGRLRMANAEGQNLREGDAYAPWSLWNDPSVRGTPLALVAAAVLAANPHDTQPWLFRIGDDAIEVLADLSRNLGAMDAFVREMHLGLGCAIENMLVAAGPNGYDAEVALVEGSLANFTERRSPVAAATVNLKKRIPRAPDGCYRAIALRHTIATLTCGARRYRRTGSNSCARLVTTRVCASSCSTKARIGAHSMRRSLKRPKPSSTTRQ